MKTESPFRSEHEEHVVAGEAIVAHRKFKMACAGLSDPSTLPRAWRAPTLENRVLDALCTSSELTLREIKSHLQCAETGAVLALARLLACQLVIRYRGERDGRAGAPTFRYSLHPRMRARVAGVSDGVLR